MRARLAAAPRQAWLQACSLDHLQEWVQEVVKKTCSVVKTFLKVLSQPKWTPEAGLKPGNGFGFHNRKMFFFLMRARLAAALRQARLEACSLDHVQDGVQEVVKKYVSVVKKKPF